MDKTFFTSDTHFHHANIIKHAKRPFADVNEMDAVLKENWNRTVPKDANVWHLGDFSWKNGFPSHITKQLNGHIKVLKGNHDTWAMPTIVDDVFYDGSPYAELSFTHTKHVVMCHYPLCSWNGMHHNSVHLFGHCHSNLQPFIERCMPNAKMLDVGVDNIARILGGNKGDYRPVSYTEVMEILNKKPGQTVDHHKREGEHKDGK